jgi:hypothetical protein
MMPAMWVTGEIKRPQVIPRKGLLRQRIAAGFQPLLKPSLRPLVAPDHADEAERGDAFPKALALGEIVRIDEQPTDIVSIENFEIVVDRIPGVQRDEHGVGPHDPVHHFDDVGTVGRPYGNPGAARRMPSDRPCDRDRPLGGFTIRPD